jgi:hypothetical protein
MSVNDFVSAPRDSFGIDRKTHEACSRRHKQTPHRQFSREITPIGGMTGRTALKLGNPAPFKVIARSGQDFYNP